jgi:aminoglycoside/choline kinase family phosphotransferase
MGTEVLFRQFPRPVFQDRRIKTQRTVGASRFARNRKTACESAKGLVHRDFQSQNIIIQNVQANLIDFQGMRPGMAEYDLASLFFDPYVDLSSEERSALLLYYRQKQAENGVAVDGRSDHRLQLCATQRLMQALGLMRSSVW